MAICTQVFNKESLCAEELLLSAEFFVCMDPVKRSANGSRQCDREDRCEEQEDTEKNRRQG